MFPGGKDDRCVGLTILPPSSAYCLEIWEPQPPGTLRACSGLLWDCFTIWTLQSRSRGEQIVTVVTDDTTYALTATPPTHRDEPS